MTPESGPPDDETPLAPSRPYPPGKDPADLWEDSLGNAFARMAQLSRVCKAMTAKGLTPPSKDEISAAIEDMDLDGLIARLEDSLAFLAEHRRCGGLDRGQWRRV